MIKKFFSKISKTFESTIFASPTNKKLLQENIQEIRNALISADCGINTTNAIIKQLKQDYKPNQNLVHECKKIIENILMQSRAHFKIQHTPEVIVICGTNGAGKTTTIGKLGFHLKERKHKKVLIAGCDTFRAAAKEQLQIWTEKCRIDYFTDNVTSCPSALAYKALEHSIDKKYDVLIIDTSGRLSNNINLMNELKKIVRVLKKLIPNAPNHILLILDANLGQNIYNQVEQFKKEINITGLIITKLDNCAKGGTMIGIANMYKLPIYYVGVGEGKEDLLEFEPKQYVESLFAQSQNIK